MRILNLENNAYNLDQIPAEVDDVHFCILDNTDPKEPDYFYVPLIFLESFNSPALVLNIGGNIIQMPMDWQILIGEPDLGDLEIVPMSAINDRGFNVFCFNPRTSFRPEFHRVDIIDIYQDVKWYFPKLKPGQMLAVPLTDGKNPLCAYFIKEANRLSEVVDYSQAW